MTREEAIKNLEHYRYCLDFQFGWFGEDDNEAIDMAIEALRREKPKNPVINFVSDADGSRRLNEGLKEEALLCPVCHRYYGEVYDEGYCRHCGQKLIQKRVRVIEE